jgi:hypothetical protein
MPGILEYAWFGDRLLCRVGSCPLCGQASFVEGFATTCCGAEVQFTGARARRESPGDGRRRSPNNKIRVQILGAQGRRCFYCGCEFGSVYVRNGRELVRRLNWDHFVPFAYLQSNPNTNWVASCNVCNSIKQGRIFYDRTEARNVISSEARTRGYLLPLAE